MMNKKLIKQNGFYKLIEGDFILAKVDFNGHSSIHYPIGKLSLKNCQFIESDFDLDELADEFSRKFPNDSEPIRYASFIIGAKTILEILGDKKFSEKDVISMIEKSRETGLTAEYLILNNQQNEWGVEIVTEPMNIDEIREQGKGFLHCNTDKYKLDVEGKIILKRI
jgi:hypothetical protein